jgi:mRNA-degrading endonuclease toxin of MazEF toxin-antitoxin module
VDSDSVVTLNHIRSIDRARLVRKLGKVSSVVMRQVDRSLIVSLAIDINDFAE